MTGRLYIDGNDIYVNYGIYVTNAGYNELVSYPELKNIDFNDWHEEDGIEADLSAPRLDTKEFSIKFAYHGSNNMLDKFFRVLSDKAYHDFNFSEIDTVKKLRLVSEDNNSVYRNLRVFVLKFADDFPLNDYIYTPPQSSIFGASKYQIDGIDLSQYGVAVLKDTIDSVLSTPQVKQNLLTNNNAHAGAIYDNSAVKYKHKDVKINCIMRANSLSELWRNYNALLYNLTLPNERILTIEQLEASYNFYYKNCNVERFAPTGKIWIGFSLTLVFTRYSPIGNIAEATWSNFTNIWEEKPLEISGTWDDFINIWEAHPIEIIGTWDDFVNIAVEVCANDYSYDYSKDYNRGSPDPPYLLISPTNIFVTEEIELNEDTDIQSNTEWNVE
jgi:hypothetical protein